MKWTALWSLMLTGALLTSCGGDSGGGNVSGDLVSGSTAVDGVSRNNSCTAPLNSYFVELRDLTNQKRAEKGASPLSFSFQLGHSAQDYAEDLATQNFFSHVGKDQSTYDSRIKAAGYTGSGVGENLAAGYYNAQATFSAWMASTLHRDNLLNSAFTEVGFGTYKDTSSTYGQYWVQHLGTGNSQGGIYIPEKCGLETTTTASTVPNAVVAGRSNLNAPNKSTHQAAQPESAYGGEGLTLPGNGTIPVGSLAFAVADSTRNGGNQEIPEPALLLGLAGLGVALWRDRKVAAKKASTLAIDTDQNTDSVCEF